MTVKRIAALVSVAAAALGGAGAQTASAQLPPGVVALVSAKAGGSTRELATPRLRVRSRHALLIAFVIADGAAGSEHVARLAGDGLHWRRVSHSGTGSGTVEIWQARSKHPASGRIVVGFAVPAHGASITVAAYGGASPYLSARAATRGHASTPHIKLRPTAGSLLWTMGLTEGQRTPVVESSSPEGARVLMRSFEPNRRIGRWVDLTASRSTRAVSAAGLSWARDWGMAAVDVVVPGLKRQIEEGLLDAYGARHRSGALPSYCPPMPAFEVGVQDDPVFLGMQPAMSPARGFEVGASKFQARLLRLNVMWGQVKLYGWGPYDRAVKMANERCWGVHMTIMWTPTYAEGVLNSELSSKNLNAGLLASFATEIVKRYAGKVGRFAIGDEPDRAIFLARGATLATQIASYDRMYMAAYSAIRAADPSAEVIAGEIDGINFWTWLHNVASLPSNGVGIHPYSLTNKTAEFVSSIRPVPLLVTEDGIQASERDQLARDHEREELARAGGAKAFIFYQLSRADSIGSGWWDSGIE